MKKIVATIQAVDWRQIFPAALTIVTVLLGLMYIWQVNMSATAGFEMRALESSIDELQSESQRLDVKIAELQSIESVTTRMDMLGLRPVQRIEYLVPGGSNVAINR